MTRSGLQSAVSVKTTQAVSTSTTSTISQRRKGVRYADMPAVLRDAVVVTKKLGIPYLWIDSLCILQDDTSDWEKQYPQIDRIYGHAEVTILAASSTSCRESFLRPETPSTLLPLISTQRPGFGGLLLINFWKCSVLPGERNSRSVFATMDLELFASRLAGRGWAFQERILSTRRIVFGMENVYFNCGETTCASLGKPPFAHRNEYGIDLVRDMPVVSELYNAWSDILDQFGHLSMDGFTEPTDLLPAISGLAAYFGGLLEDKYCAGHWLRDLEIGLLWYRKKSSRDLKTSYLDGLCSPTPYTVPSWSQLGKTGRHLGRVYFQSIFRDYNRGVPKINAKIRLSGENLFGAIQDAQLKVHNHCMCLQNAKTTTLKLVSVRLYEQWHLEFIRKDKSIRWCDAWIDYNLPESEAYEDAQEWKWMLLGVRSKGLANTKHGKAQVFGLLLRQAKDFKWYRIGIFRSHLDHPLLLQDFIEMGGIETITIH
ncbi:hypothetical protein O1611_g6061 [Lasiodiplodia mahajangana]|uniref:Uncharacterized protein n=1 Tax=Lasiodiplodia mahajangana TaxID=1108764 RepID=A0ACC2JJF3_9PEZI|nr:hypothetical protein O1611_g6061 [Lasiodiplodia mahajangana]